MPDPKKPSQLPPRPSRRKRSPEGYLLLQDGSIDGRSLRITGRVEKFTVRVTHGFSQEVKLIARRTGKTMGQVVQEAVRGYFSLPKPPPSGPGPS